MRAGGVMSIGFLDRAMRDGRREKDPLAPHDRGRVALTGDGPLPSDVLQELESYSLGDLRNSFKNIIFIMY